MATRGKPPSGGKSSGGKKQSGNKTSSLASDILAGRKTPTKADSLTLAASVLSQDETKGKRR